MGVIAHTQNFASINATALMHFVKFDSAGKPMLELLADCMYRHVIEYCLSAIRVPKLLDKKEGAKYTKEAKALFRDPPATPDDPDRTGEAGELLLYLFIEAVLGAPQMVAKMDLKTNTNDELKGSDGIHMRWNEHRQMLEVIFGESKIHASLSSALDSAVKTITAFHGSEQKRHELRIATKHLKYASPTLKTAVEAYLLDGIPRQSVLLRQVCLVGFNWDKYAKLPKSTQEIEAYFLELYRSECNKFIKAFDSRSASLLPLNLEFDVIFLPFQSVQDFRNAFRAALK